MSRKYLAEALRSIAQNDYMIDGNYLQGGETLNRAADCLDSEARHAAQDAQLQAIGRGAFESIAEMVAALECDYDRLEELRELGENMPAEDWASDEYTDEREELRELTEASGERNSREDAEQRISEDPLSIELSGKWTVGSPPVAGRAYILLSTGGPATRIVCELDDGEPHRAWIQAQDWGTPWTDFNGGDSEILLTYCRQFYFGEG